MADIFKKKISEYDRDLETFIYIGFLLKAIENAERELITQVHTYVKSSAIDRLVKKANGLVQPECDIKNWVDGQIASMTQGVDDWYFSEVNPYGRNDGFNEKMQRFLSEIEDLACDEARICEREKANDQ